MADGTSALPTTPADAPTSGAGEAAHARSLVERQVEALGELVEIGMRLARAIDRQAGEAGAEPPPLAELNTAAVAFGRAARAVRLSIMLQTRLTEEAQGAGGAGAGQPTPKQDVEARVAAMVARVIEAEHDDRGEVARLRAEAAERLEDERHGDVMARPVYDIVVDICADLGLHPDLPGLGEAMADAQEVAWSAAGEPGEFDLIWLTPEGRPYTPRGRNRSGRASDTS